MSLYEVNPCSIEEVVLLIIMAKQGYIPTVESRYIDVDNGFLTNAQTLRLCGCLEKHMQKLRYDAEFLFEGEPYWNVMNKRYERSDHLEGGRFVWNFSIAPRFRGGYMRKWL